MPAQRAAAGLLICLLLGGCFGRAAGTPSAVFDFGAMPAPASAPAPMLRSVDVSAPSWLDTPALQYRLAYVDGARRNAYADSRWAAAPGELLEKSLRRALLATADGGASCRLRVELDEFQQVFDSTTESRGELALRASLISPQAERVLARRSFNLSEPALRADASGGAAALGRAGNSAAAALGDWLMSLPATVARLCRGG